MPRRSRSTPDYQPAPGITRYLCGTQPIISMAALECGLDTLLAAEPLGGMVALRAKSLALTDLFIDLVETRCAGHGLTLATPREHARRGSQVCLARGAGAYAIVQALIARGVIGDFRAGDGGLSIRTSCASASRPCTSASKTSGTPWSTSAGARHQRMAKAGIQPETRGDLIMCPSHPITPPVP
jgi:hypothetical protein